MRKNRIDSILPRKHFKKVGSEANREERVSSSIYSTFRLIIGIMIPVYLYGHRDLNIQMNACL